MLDAEGILGTFYLLRGHSALTLWGSSLGGEGCFHLQPRPFTDLDERKANALLALAPYLATTLSPPLGQWLTPLRLVLDS